MTDEAARLKSTGRFGPGNPGKPRGAVNKVGRDLREMVRVALDEAGGVEYLVKQAHANPTAFLALVGRLIPKDVKVAGDLQVDHRAAVAEAVQTMMANLFKPPGGGVA
jgi:hypothetical protein